MCRRSAWPFRLFARSPAPNPLPTNGPAPGSAAGLTLAQATELLDLLERRGVTNGEAAVAPDGLFSVRWGGAAEPESERRPGAGAPGSGIS